MGKKNGKNELVKADEYLQVELVEPTKPRVGVKLKDSNAKVTVNTKIVDVDVDIDVKNVKDIMDLFRKGY